MPEGGDFFGVPKKSSSLGMDSFIFLPDFYSLINQKVLETLIL